jgi:hypothetical protein
MIQITQGGVVVQPGAIEKLGADYRDTGVAIVPGFLAPPVLRALLKGLTSGGFDLTKELQVKGATLLMPLSDPALISLHFMVNRPELFEIASCITGLPKPGNFMSRLHRTNPAPDLHLDWHDDGADYRMLGMNINLSTQPYTGGVLQVRNPEKRIVAEIGQLPPGDAFFFRIGDRWQHRLTPVESGERTVAVGWFRTQPDWRAVALAGFRTSMIVLEAGWQA